jgi:hypothetical protein
MNERTGLMLREAAMWGLAAAIGGIGVLALSLVLGGCATQPTRFDEALFTLTNVPAITQRPITNVYNVTNWSARTVEVVQTNTVMVTNALQQLQVIPVYITNTIPVQVPQVAQVTNVIPAGTVTNVTQLAAPSTATQTGTGIVGAIAGLFGWGGLATTALGGLLAGYQRSRNATLMAAATGASTAQQVTEQAAGVLTQNVQTLLAVLQTSPQGQALLPAIKSYLTSHQAETGTFATIATLIQKNVNDKAAQDAASEILGALNALGQPATTRA